MEKFPKKILKALSIYDKWNFKPQISSIFHFDRVSDGRMAHVLGVKIIKGLGPKNPTKWCSWGLS